MEDFSERPIGKLTEFKRFFLKKINNANNN